MDDVLLDTSNYLMDWHKKNFPFNDKRNCGSREIHKLLGMTWRECWDDLPQLFWETIPFTPWAKQLIALSEEYFPGNVFLLTSPIPNGVCSAGKQLWVNNFLPAYQGKLIIGHKKYACVAEDGLLIDDSYTNEEKFAQYGKSNSFYLFPSYQNKLFGYVPKMYNDPSDELASIEELYKSVCKSSSAL